jgi:diguanylate cyclase (GGDEF)-like protein/PAS domain S-box-containing protein
MMHTVLIVDDSEHDRVAHQRALRQAGCEVRTSQTIAGGLELAASLRPDVILLDYNLPDGNGLEFLRQIGVDGVDGPPVVMLTGSGNEAVAVEAIKAGAYDYLIKDLAGGHLKLLPAVVERVLREHRLRLSKRDAERQLQLAANVFHNISEGIVATRPDGVIVSVNPAFCAMTGYRAEELIGNNPRMVKSDRHPPAFFESMWACISLGDVWQGEVWNRRKDGSLFLVRETITAIRDDQGRLQHYVAVQNDITVAKQAEDFIHHQAYHDALTGLPNRSLFMDRLKHQLARAQRHRDVLAVMFVDLDHFKAVNDLLGHDIGDELLRQASARLQQCTRASDTVARLGGDEFTVILADTASRDDARVVAAKIVEQMVQPFQIGGHTLNISATVGIALYPGDGDSVSALMTAADAAMYRVKRESRGGYAFVAAE